MRRPWLRRRPDADASSSTSPPPFVLGAQLAAAQAEEAKVRAAHPELASPLADEYDFWAGETDLSRLVQSRVDGEVTSLVRDFVGLDHQGRTLMRTSVTIENLYTILQFCRRAAVASLRERDPDLARNALRAVALIDVDRVDWRDVPGPLELAAYAVKATGGDLGDELGRLRAMSAEKIGSMIGRLQSPAIEPSLQSSGYAGVTTLHGFGLVDCWSGGSESISLGPLLIGLADAIDADDYRTSSVTLSDGLPSVWFPRLNRTRVEAIVDGAPAGGSVSARHRPGPGAEAQQFSVFVLNAGTGELASELLRLAEHEESTTHASLALARGAIFVLVIARSWVQGIDGLETSEALGRFAEPFMSVLRDQST
jgi:hypothetical protein